MEKQQPKKRWCYPRHALVTQLVKLVLWPYLWLRYRVKVEPFRAQGSRPYLILLNHQTPFDQLFVGKAFRGPVYYMATEDIFSLGFVSDALRYLVAPIPIRKQNTDVQAVMNCLRVAREGGTIAIAPEGNRTYSGRTGYMNPAICGLVKKLGLPVAFFRIEGGYGVEPRWSSVTRRGPMKAYVSCVMEPEEYQDLSKEALYNRICAELLVDEARVDGVYRHKKAAEYLERAIYICPKCGLAEHVSHRDTIRCTRCGLTARYLPTRELEGVGEPFPFRFVAQWYDYQCDFINALDVTALTDKPLFRDEARLSEVILYKRKVPLRKKAALALYGDRVEIDPEGPDPLVIPFEEVSAASVLGRNKANLYHGKTVYQLKGGHRFNALKYVNLFYRYKNIRRGDTNGKFLGL